MSGIVYRPEPAHICCPGWRWKPIDDDSDIPHEPGAQYGIPPSHREFPKGVVWLCDCGQAWVSLGLTGGGPQRSGGYAAAGLGWQRERRGERRRRLRHSRELDPGTEVG